MTETLFALDEYADYDTGLKKLGYEIHAWETFGDWQGDYVAVISRDGKIGFVVIGFGSCSGCDALQDCDWHGMSYRGAADIEKSDKKIRDLFNWIESEIVWGTPSELCRKFLKNDMRWYRFDDGFKASQRAIVESLVALHESEHGPIQWVNK